MHQSSDRPIRNNQYKTHLHSQCCTHIKYTHIHIQTHIKHTHNNTHTQTSNTHAYTNTHIQFMNTQTQTNNQTDTHTTSIHNNKGYHIYDLSNASPMSKCCISNAKKDLNDISNKQYFIIDQ